MRGVLAVAARKIAEWKLAFPAALAVGLLPLALALLPVWRGNAHEARSATMLGIVGAILVAVPLFLGATILVPDLAGKRLGFFFSRPLSGLALWAGKLLGALFVSIGCAFLAAAPALIVEGRRAFTAVGLDPRDLLAIAFAGALFLILLAHVVASMVRLRAAWAVLDLLFAAFFTVVIPLSLPGLLGNPHGGGLWWRAAAALGILLAASCVQVVDGRTDARRSHGALSATLWGLAAVFTAILSFF
jgi:hypothetical protein